MGSSRPFGNIRKLKSGRYQARYYHLGKQVPADDTFATKAEARAWLATMETEILGGRHVDPSSGRETFGNYARRWLGARDVRPRTRDTYESQLAHILEEFETIELRKITPADVRAWHGRQAKSEKHSNTVAKIYRLFRTMMETAVDDGLLRVNPVHIKGAAVEQSAERPALDWDDVAEQLNAEHGNERKPRAVMLFWLDRLMTDEDEARLQSAEEWHVQEQQERRNPRRLCWTRTQMPRMPKTDPRFLGCNR